MRSRHDVKACESQKDHHATPNQRQRRRHRNQDVCKNNKKKKQESSRRAFCMLVKVNGRKNDIGKEESEGGSSRKNDFNVPSVPHFFEQFSSSAFQHLTNVTVLNISLVDKFYQTVPCTALPQAHKSQVHSRPFFDADLCQMNAKSDKDRLLFRSITKRENEPESVFRLARETIATVSFQDNPQSIMACVHNKHMSF